MIIRLVISLQIYIRVIYQKILLPMSQRKTWTSYEDQKLKQIILHKNIIKWSQVSKVMQSQYNIFGRSGKQCRQRWHNQLDPNIKTDSWTKEQEQLLFQSHNKLGNKWAKIAETLNGRTDNCVKNHFYSTLRKSIRRLNKFISDNKIKGQYRQITNTTLYKIIGIAEDKFERKHQVSDQLIDLCNSIKQKLLQYSKQKQFENDEILSLIRSITGFNKSYRKKKSKKKKKVEQSSIQSQQEIIEKQMSIEKKIVSIEIQKSEKIPSDINIPRTFSLFSQQNKIFKSESTTEIKEKVPEQPLPLKQKKNLIVGGTIKKVTSTEYQEAYFGQQISKIINNKFFPSNFEGMFYQHIPILQRSESISGSLIQLNKLEADRFSLEVSRTLSGVLGYSWQLNSGGFNKQVQKNT